MTDDEILITNPMDISLSKFWETVKDKEAWNAAVMLEESDMIGQLNNKNICRKKKSSWKKFMFILFFILPFSFFLFFFLTLTVLRLHCSTQALHCDACLFSSCGMRASLVVVLNALLLWNMGSRTFRLSSCGVQS